MEIKMPNNKVTDNCSVKDFSHKTPEKEDNWETASKFLGMIFGISEEQRKDCTKKAKNDYYSGKSEEK